MGERYGKKNGAKAKTGAKGKKSSPLKRKKEEVDSEDGYEAAVDDEGGGDIDNDNDSGSEAGSEAGSEVGSETGSQGEGGKDGFADAMSRILGQSVSTSVPVMAKRSTSQMKAITQTNREKGELREKRLKRLAERDKQMVKPTVLQHDKEKQLKRIATRGGT